MLKLDTTALVVIDVQGKLAQMMHDKETMFANLHRMIESAKILDLPILWTEQVPDKLGATTPELSERLIEVAQPIAKSAFSCCGEPAFADQLTRLNKTQFLLTGLEAHICIYQTTRDLLKQGHEVHLVSDAISARFAHNKAIGLARMKDEGACLTSTEMALFELMQVAEGPAFKAIAKLMK